jgi:hypothetical protein
MMVFARIGKTPCYRSIRVRIMKSSGMEPFFAIKNSSITLSVASLLRVRWSLTLAPPEVPGAEQIVIVGQQNRYRLGQRKLPSLETSADGGDSMGNQTRILVP